MGIKNFPKIQKEKTTYDRMLDQGGQSGSSEMFPVQPNIKSQYSMFGYIFQEIANIRMEVSRLGIAVRVNNNSSPSYLEMYHAHIYSFLIPVSVIISEDKWKKVENLWMLCGKEINEYFARRNSIPNLKIPKQLIERLDKLYRIALILAQHANLGITVETESDISKAIEDAITGG
jgi:hypothetical protein